ncbi:MAG: T9SS type A sorting domain-containing protein [Bacteroidota bacterium]
MKTVFTSLCFLFFSCSLLQAQSTLGQVYNIFQAKCVSCHNHNAPEAGLDLEGAGSTAEAKIQSVYDNLFRVTPENDFAAGKGYVHIYPGRPDQSFLFRKINQGLERTITLEAGEEDPMPLSSQPQLSDMEKEMIRQWILYGAPRVGTVVDEQIIDDYYNLNGVASFPDGPPPAPAEGEGFQIKVGPFYLTPAGQAGHELEFFQKYELMLPENIEVDRIDMQFSNYSHHFIIYNFESQQGASVIPDGLRLEADHSDISLVAAIQEPTDLGLPEGTGFRWDKDMVLDLNSHYINYSSTSTYQAEVYVNIYTQPVGTAKQEMKTELIANLNIPIPNNGDWIEHQQNINYNLGEVYLWGLMGHTHKYGRGYKVFKRINGQVADLIYDASCPWGVPGCASPNFDYQHIPLRYYDTFEPIMMNAFNGLRHEAAWVNEGPFSVNFGPTSNDEMMVLVMMYLEDTTGVSIITSVAEPEAINPLSEVMVYPNPVESEASIVLPADLGRVQIRMYDLLGREVKNQILDNGRLFFMDCSDLEQGVYVYMLIDSDGHQLTRKLMVE